MKGLLTLIVVVIILLPMLFYLNPFVWGMRWPPKYTPSVKTMNLIDSLDKKNNIKIYINTEETRDTLWYFRDLKNGRQKQLANFKLAIENIDDKPIDTNLLISYLNEFSKNFEHKKYFDSIFLYNDNSIIYKIKLNE